MQTPSSRACSPRCRRGRERHRIVPVARSRAAGAHRRSRARGAPHRGGRATRRASQPVHRDGRRVPADAALPAGRRPETSRLEALRPHRSSLHAGLPRDDRMAGDARTRHQPVHGICRRPRRCQTANGHAPRGGAHLPARAAGRSRGAGRRMATSTGDTLPARTGRPHLVRMLGSARRAPAPTAAPTSRARIRRAAARLGRRGCLALVSDLYGADDMHPALREVRRMGHEVVDVPRAHARGTVAVDARRRGVRRSREP